jgi:hypothetical protein
MPVAEAVHGATTQLLARHRHGLLARWAPIITVGSPLEER